MRVRALREPEERLKRALREAEESLKRGGGEMRVSVIAAWGRQ
jgi:hypothetical protein